MKEALERFREAVADKPKGARGKLHGKRVKGSKTGARHQQLHHAEVRPEDVIALCDAVPADQQDRRVRELRAGSERAIAERHPDLDEESEAALVAIQADHAHLLLELAGGGGG